MLHQFSEEVAAVAEKACAGLVHIGGNGISGRTGVIWRDGLVLSLARQADDGETIELFGPDKTRHQAVVKAWDSRTGLVLLGVEALKAPIWKPSPAPRLGNLAITIAFASPGGHEVRLDAVRFVSSPGEWVTGVPLDTLIQTDGSAFPGFSGAVLLNTEGALMGWVCENRHGNQGFALGASDLERLGEELLNAGSRRRPYLGVYLRPVSHTSGLVVVGVEDTGPGASAGWQVGDLLLELAGHTLDRLEAFSRVLAVLEPGKSAAARLLRGSQVLELPVTPVGR
jgi:S1-C subfamily serine protease